MMSIKWSRGREWGGGEMAEGGRHSKDQLYSRRENSFYILTTSKFEESIKNNYYHVNVPKGLFSMFEYITTMKCDCLFKINKIQIKI